MKHKKTIATLDSTKLFKKPKPKTGQSKPFPLGTIRKHKTGERFGERRKGDEIRNCIICEKDGERIWMLLSRFKAEQALGKSLNSKHPVHHFDEDTENDKNNNLVVCEDSSYHSFLHKRKGENTHECI